MPWGSTGLDISKVGVPMIRTVVAVSTLFLGLVPLAASAAEKAAFSPTKPVRLIVPYPAGGSNDIVARMMAPKLSDLWRQSVVVENKIGASGILASDFVANSPPDGHAILFGSNSATTIADHLTISSPTFKGMADLVPLTNVLTVPAVLVANPKVTASTVPELVDLLKKNPGKFNYSSSGAQSGYHLSMIQFQRMTGTRLVHVPFGGLAPAELAVIAGNVELMLDSAITSLNYIRGGQMKVLGIASLETWPLAPHYPKISDVLPGFQSVSFIGLFAARGTPADLAAKLTQDLRAIINEPEMRKRLLDLGALSSSIGNSTDDFKVFLEQDSKTWGTVIRAGRDAP